MYVQKRVIWILRVWKFKAKRRRIPMYNVYKFERTGPDKLIIPETKRRSNSIIR